MPKLKGFQRTYLRGLAHKLKPVVQIGQGGLSEGVVTEIDAALDRHELIKVRFNDMKEREDKQELARHIEQSTGGEWIGLIGHVAVFFRRQPDANKRSIRVPLRDTRGKS